MNEVLNEMGIAYAVVGNHDFDFGPSAQKNN